MGNASSRGERSGESTFSPKHVTRSLRGIDFPASKEDLIEKARSENAGEEVLRHLERMPDQEYQNMADVMRGFGQSNEAEEQDE